MHMYFNYCRGGYTVEQLQEVDAYAEEKGIELRVNIQVLGHLHYLKRHNCYAPLFDTNDSLMVGDSKVYELVDKMLATMSKAVKSRVIHIGMDEIFELGLGRYLKENGYVNNRVLFLEHLNRVVELAKKYNYTCEIWSDMFFRMVQGSDFGETGVIPADIRDSIPEGVRIVHWYYVKQPDENFTRHLRENKAICDEVSFATCARKITGLSPENKYCAEMIEQQLRICRQEEIDHFMVTVWTDCGAHCSNYAVLPVLFATAEMARGKSLAEVDKATSEGSSVSYATNDTYSTDGTAVRVNVKGVWTENNLKNATFVPAVSIQTNALGEHAIADLAELSIDVYNAGKEFDVKVRFYSGTSYVDVANAKIKAGKNVLTFAISDLRFEKMDTVDRIAFEFQNAEDLSCEFYLDNIAGKK